MSEELPLYGGTTGKKGGMRLSCDAAEALMKDSKQQ
jgi:hypothetical protein